MPNLREARLRQAKHYLTVLRTVNELYQHDRNALQRGLALFDLEWGNIQAEQIWAYKNALGEPSPGHRVL